MNNEWTFKTKTLLRFDMNELCKSEGQHLCQWEPIWLSRERLLLFSLPFHLGSFYKHICHWLFFLFVLFVYSKTDLLVKKISTNSLVLTSGLFGLQIKPPSRGLLRSRGKTEGYGLDIIFCAVTYLLWMSKKTVLSIPHL